MDWIVERQLHGGIRVPPHVRAAQRTRMRVSVEWQMDPRRNRRSLVACARPADIQVEPLQLFDVQLLPGVGGAWALAGYEYQPGGPHAADQVVGQSWLLTPAPDEDLERAELQVQRLTRQLSALG